MEIKYMIFILVCNFLFSCNTDKETQLLIQTDAEKGIRKTYIINYEKCLPEFQYEKPIDSIKSEKKLIKLIERIHSKNKAARFIVYSESFKYDSEMKNFKTKVSHLTFKDNIKPLPLSYNLEDKHEAFVEILDIGIGKLYEKIEN